jgi:predicted alpha/beta superfamily hydrolase
MATVVFADPLPRHEISTTAGPAEIVVQSRILDEDRRLLVRLPREYGNGEAAYPVLFVLDAEWHFNLASADVELLSECSYLGRHPVPGMIVVGVVNTDRNRDFTPTHRPDQAGMKFPTSGEAERFRRFLVEEVLPVVDANFRTRPFRILAGWSLGGLFTVNTLLGSTPVFDAYLAISPSLWWDDEWTVGQLRRGALGKGPAAMRQLVVTLGSVESDRESLVARSTTALMAYLDEHPLENVTTELVPIEGMGHNFSPKLAYFFGLATIFADLDLPQTVVDEGLDSVDAYFAALSARYRFPLLVPEDVYGRIGWGLFEDGRIEEAGAVLRTWAERHPQSSVAVASLGSFCKETGETERALDLFRRAIDLEERSDRPRPEFIVDLRRDIDAMQDDG